MTMISAAAESWLRVVPGASRQRLVKSPLPVLSAIGDWLLFFTLMAWMSVRTVALSGNAFLAIVADVAAILAVAGLLLYGCYRRRANWGEQISCLITVWLQWALIWLIFMLWHGVGAITSLTLAVSWFLVGVITACGWRVLLLLLVAMRRPNEVMARKFCILGTGEHASRLHDIFAADPAMGSIYSGRYVPYLEKQGVFDMHGGSFHDLVLAVQDGQVEDVFCSVHGFAQADLKAMDAMAACRVKVYCVDDPYIVTNRQELYQHSHLVHCVPVSDAWQAVKDFIDRTAALLSLALLSPLLAVVSIIIKLDSQGPAIFLQPRGGINNRAFTIFKFRTMRVEAALDKTVPQARSNDKRITRVGKFLRVSSIDELPQLTNVLIGDMSFIGPRPHSVVHDERYMELVPDYIKRMRVKPGLSGWAQIHGSRGYLDSIESIQRRIDLDNEYIDNWSFRRDIEVAIKTVLIVLKATNAG